MKKKWLNFKKNFLNFIKYNIQYCSYVILSIFCCIVIRAVTVGNAFSIKPLVFDIATSLMIGSFAYYYKPKKQFTYLLVCLCVLSLVCIVNAIYYEWYNSFASFSLLTTLGQVKEVDDAIVAKLKVIHFIYLLAPIAFVYINKYLNNRDYFNFVSKFEKSKELFKKVMLYGFIILLIGTASLSGTAFSRLSKQWNREYIVSRFGITIYQINDLIGTLRPTISSWFGYDVALKEFNDYYENNTIPVSNNSYTNLYKDYNVIFVHMESMMSFLIDLKINDTVITPNLNKLSQESIYFTNFYPQISVGTSSDTEFTLTTSLMPASNGTAFVTYYDREYVTIPKLLREKGYYTFSMHGNKASMWNRNKMHPSLGYMDFYSSTSYDIDQTVGLGLDDHSFFKQSLPILENIEKNNDKYMGTIITLSNHTPFANDEKFEQIDLTYKAKVYNEYSGKNEEVTYSYLDNTKLGNYIRSAHYADNALGEFIDMVNNSDYFNNTLFVFYGDHDPKLSRDEFNYYYNFNPETGKLYTSDDENYVSYDYFANELNRKTPLILWTKNNKQVKKVDYYMGMIDVMPTVGNMIGIYNKYALGHDIFEIKDDNIIAFPNGNFLTNRLYYRSTNETYKPLSLDDVLTDSYVNECKDYADKIIEVSNDIITHDLIRDSKNKEGAS